MRNSTTLVYSEAGPIPSRSTTQTPFAAVTMEHAVDLVCRDVITIGENTLSHDCGVDTFYFCSPFCHKRFSAEPDRFVPMTLGQSEPIAQLGKNHAAA